MDIYRLAYISTTTFDDNSSELLSLVTHARKNNQRSHISSVLINGQGLFIQILEGDRPTVESLFEKIKVDTRHRDVCVIFSETTQQRQFQHWFLRYLSLSQTRLDRSAGFQSFIKQYFQEKIIVPGSPVINGLKHLSFTTAE